MRRVRGLLLALMVSVMFYATPSRAAQGARQDARQYALYVVCAFDVLSVDEYGAPDTRVFSVVNGRRIFLLRARSQFHIIERPDFRARGVPARAFAACAGASAGQGQNLFRSVEGVD